MTATLTPREERGLKLAQGGQITELENGWSVRSETRNVHYLVHLDKPSCTCPDFELRRERCKHICAVEYFSGRRAIPEGDEGADERKQASVRPTYPQNWSMYNAAQTREKPFFMRLLGALCATVPQPEQVMGRPRLSLGDMVFAAVYKVYGGFSSRRFTGDLEEACKQGLIGKVPHFNSVTGYLSDPELTSVLDGLVMLSSLPFTRRGE